MSTSKRMGIDARRALASRRLACSCAIIAVTGWGCGDYEAMEGAGEDIESAELGGLAAAISAQNGYGWNVGVGSGFTGSRCDHNNSSHDCRFRSTDQQLVDGHVDEWNGMLDAKGNIVSFAVLDGQTFAILSMNAMNATEVRYREEFTSPNCGLRRGTADEFSNFTFSENVTSTAMTNAVHVRCDASAPISEDLPLAGARYCTHVEASINPDIVQWAGRREVTAVAAQNENARIMEQVYGHVLARCGGVGTHSPADPGDYAIDQITYSSAGGDGTDSLSRFEQCLMNEFNDGGFTGPLNPSTGC